MACIKGHNMPTGVQGVDVVGGVPTAPVRCPESFQDPAIKALITAPSSVPSSWRQLSQPPGPGSYVSMLEGGTFVGTAAVATCRF